MHANSLYRPGPAAGSEPRCHIALIRLKVPGARPGREPLEAARRPIDASLLYGTKCPATGGEPDEEREISNPACRPAERRGMRRLGRGWRPDDDDLSCSSRVQPSGR